MTSESAYTTAQATTELDELYSTGLELAKEKLAEDGRFYPFGLAIGVDRPEGDDEVDVLEVGTEEEDGEVDEEDAFNGLVAAFDESKDSFRAVAIVFDATVDEEWDAITVLAAHVQGEMTDVQLPYRVSGSKRVFADLEQAAGSFELWHEATE
jgi:hypothetical protein